MLTLFLKQLQDQLITQQKINSFCIGYSGGLDSTVLLKLFSLAKEQLSPLISIQAIHINHGLNPQSNKWEQHCQNICDQLKVPLLIQKVKVDTKQGIEAGAREARYLAIKEQLQENQSLVTAHHLDDQAETFFLALKRGSGPKGLIGLKTNSFIYGINIFRPLLEVSKQQILEFAKQQKLVWIEDDSNLDINYERNFLRHQILPKLNQKWEYFNSNLSRTANLCKQQQELLEELLQQQLESLLTEDNNLNIKDFKIYSNSRRQQIIRLWLDKNKLMMPSLAQLKELINNVIFAKQDANPKLKLGDNIIRRYDNILYITPEFKDISSIQINCLVNQSVNLPDNLGKLSFLDTKDSVLVTWKIDNKSKEYKLPKLNAKDTTIKIQFKYSGKVKLSSKQPHKSIKHLMQQAHIPVWKRNRIPFIFYGKDLIAGLDVFIIEA